jgi:hypothetical protein
MAAFRQSWPLGVRPGSRSGIAIQHTAFVVMTGRSDDANIATHQKINQQALGRFMSLAAIADVNEGTEAQDAMEYQGTAEEDEAAHGMMSPGGDPARARKLNRQKVDGALMAIRGLILGGKLRPARFEFGKATHSIQDPFARAHTREGMGEDPLVWYGLSHPGPAMAHVRIDKSERMGSGNVNRAVAATQTYYRGVELATLDPLDEFESKLTAEERYGWFQKFRGVHG